MLRFERLQGHTQAISDEFSGKLGTLNQGLSQLHEYVDVVVHQHFDIHVDIQQYIYVYFDEHFYQYFDVVVYKYIDIFLNEHVVDIIINIINVNIDIDFN